MKSEKDILRQFGFSLKSKNETEKEFMKILIKVYKMGFQDACILIVKEASEQGIRTTIKKGR